MPYVVATPEMMAAAATDVAAVGSTLSAAHTAAAAPTVAVIPAAADEVSASIAQVFSRAAQEYQALAGKAAAFQQQFVQHLTASAGSYAAAEAANAVSLQSLTASVGSSVAAIPDMLTSVWNAFVTNAITFFQELYAVVFFGYVAAFLSLILSSLVIYFLIFLVEFALNKMFGILIPFSLPTL
jgi:hypothetical protein